MKPRNPIVSSDPKVKMCLAYDRPVTRHLKCTNHNRRCHARRVHMIRTVATHGVVHFHPSVYVFCFPLPHFLVTLSSLVQSCCAHHSHLLTSSPGWSIQRNNLPQTKQASPVSLKIKSADLIIDCLLSGVLFPESLIWGNRGDKRLALRPGN